MKVETRIYLNLCKHQKKKIFFGSILLMVDAIVALSMPNYLNKMIENLFLTSNEEYILSLLTYMGVLVVQLIIGFITPLLFAKIGMRNSNLLGNELVNRIIYSVNKEPLQFEKGKALEVLECDIFQLGAQGITNLYAVIHIAIYLVTLFVFMIRTNIVLAILTLIVFLISLYGQGRLNKKIGIAIHNMRCGSDRYSRWCSELLNNYVGIRRSDCSRYVKKEYANALDEYQEKNYEIEKVMNWNKAFMGAIQLSNYLVVFAIGFLLVNRGVIRLNNLITFNIYSNVFGGFITSVPGLVKSIKNFNISLERFCSIYNIEYYSKKNGPYIDEINCIEMKKVCFGYGNDTQNILNNADVYLEKSNIYLIKGDNGSGKTTLLNLLIGELKARNGTIKINDVVMQVFENKIEMDQHISYFSSSAPIFNDTIYNNITLAEQNVVDDRLESICETLNILSWINSLEKGFDTMINDVAENLSDGQLQKILLARVLRRERDIMIFDELEKHLDVSTKRNVMEYLEKIKKDKVILLVSHDTLLDKYADIIMRIKNGEVSYEGEHE